MTEQVQQTDRVHEIIKFLPQSVRTYLLNNNYLTKKDIFSSFNELPMNQIHKMFEDLILHGVITKYASYWKVSNNIKKLLMAYDGADRFVTDFSNAEDMMLISECLGADAIHFLFNTKSFQIKNIEVIINQDYIFSLNEILGEFIKRGYLNKNGTTYNVTEKFKNVLKGFVSTYKDVSALTSGKLNEEELQKQLKEHKENPTKGKKTVKQLIADEIAALEKENAEKNVHEHEHKHEEPIVKKKAKPKMKSKVKSTKDEKRWNELFRRRYEGGKYESLNDNELKEMSALQKKLGLTTIDRIERE